MMNAKNFWFWFGGIWLTVGLVFLTVGISVGIHRMSLNERLEREGRTVDGMVLTKEIYRASSKSGNTSNPSYRVTFRFLPREGEIVEGTVEVSPEEWDLLDERGPIAVTYLPDGPQSYRIQGQTDDVVLPIIFGSVGGVIGTLGGFIVFHAATTKRREKHLARSGMMADATITDVGPSYLPINGVHQVKLHYEYRDAQGKTRKGPARCPRTRPPTGRPARPDAFAMIRASHASMCGCELSDIMAGVSILQTLRRSVLLWVGAVFFAVGTIGAVIALQEWHSRQHFERESVQAKASILGKSIQKAARDGNPRTKYQATYRIELPGGGTVDHVGEVSVDEWERLVEGSPFPVRYLPSDPTTTHLDFRDPWWLPLIFAGGGLLFALIGAGVASSDIRQLLLVMQLSRTGVAAEGTVGKVWPTNTSINRVTQWRLSYQFQDHVGRSQHGQSGLLSPEEAAEWRTGDRGAVRFDRERPERSLWIGRTGS